MTGLSLRTAKVLYQRIRVRIAEACERDAQLCGEVELDESYFGPQRVPGKHGRGAGKKIIVFGLLKRRGKVYTQVVPNCTRKTLRAIIEGRVDRSSTLYSDRLKAYDGLVDVGFARHFRVQHNQDEFVRGPSHINGIESFWSYAKRRLQKFNGIPASTLELHLKECEWRFNTRDRDPYKDLLVMLRQNPLN
jgi:transposase